MQIRYMNLSDDPYKVSEIYERAWKYAYRDIIPSDFLTSIPQGKWATKLDRMNNLVLIEDNLLIGTMSFCPSRWENYKDYGEIVSIYFLPEYIGKGYGTALLQKGIYELRKLGYDKILLWVLKRIILQGVSMREIDLLVPKNFWKITLVEET